MSFSLEQEFPLVLNNIIDAFLLIIYLFKAAGIQDWRGPDGVWSNMKFETVKEDPDGPCVDYNLFRPTFTHEAIAQLLKLGYVKHVISQNVDGLHLLSGIPRENLSELHGNAFIEYCRVIKYISNAYYNLSCACYRNADIKLLDQDMSHLQTLLGVERHTKRIRNARTAKATWKIPLCTFAITLITRCWFLRIKMQGSAT